LPFKLNQNRRHRIPRQKHKVTNAAAYDPVLRQRGSLTVWFTDEAIEGWQAEPRTTPGGQPSYSSLAILTGLILRSVFRLTLRQTEGLISSIIDLLGLELHVPDHSTLSRQAKTLEVSRLQPRRNSEFLHLLVDSTGLRLYGAGEWLLEKHGTKTRRSWRKLHIGADACSGQIVAALLTAKEVDDGAEHSHRVAVVVPPRVTAVPSETAETAPTQRDRHLQHIAEHGRMAWQKASGYTMWARAEAAISRFKHVIGAGLHSRMDDCRATEVDIAVHALNRMVDLGRPNYVRTA